MAPSLPPACPPATAQLPIWISFENAELHADPIVVLFKCGDDIRQDQLTLQMIRIMDKARAPRRDGMGGAGERWAVKQGSRVAGGRKGDEEGKEIGHSYAR